MNQPQDPRSLLWDKIEHARIGIFTSVDATGHLVSCPMTNQQVDGDGSLWFFTSDHGQVSRNIAAHANVNVSFVKDGESLYVSVSGHAEHVRDRDRIAQMWNPLVAAWFPQGQDDPHLLLVKVTVESAEYWDADSSKVVQLLKMARAAVTGKPPQFDQGEHAKITL